jgi:hypothetical protein
VQVNAGRLVVVCIAGAKRNVRKRIIQELSVSSYISPGKQRSKLVAGKTPTELRALFGRQEVRVLILIPQCCGLCLARTCLRSAYRSVFFFLALYRSWCGKMMFPHRRIDA